MEDSSLTTVASVDVEATVVVEDSVVVVEAVTSSDSVITSSLGSLKLSGNSVETVVEEVDEPKHKKRRRGGKPRVNRRDRAMY